MNVYDEILASFPTFKEQCRFDLSTPYAIDGYAVATNGHIAIRCPLELLKNTYEKKERTPDLRIFNVPKLAQPLIHNLAFTNEQIKDFEAIQWKECVWCKGKGYLGKKSDNFPCDCEHGKEENIVEMFFDGRRFNQKYLILLHKIAEKLGLTSVIRTSDTPLNKQVIFEVGMIEVALMHLHEKEVVVVSL